MKESTVLSQDFVSGTTRQYRYVKWNTKWSLLDLTKSVCLLWQTFFLLLIIYNKVWHVDLAFKMAIVFAGV